MPPVTSLPWMEPLAAASACFERHQGDESFAFLHSALRTGYSGRYSILGLGPREVIRGGDLSGLAIAPGKERWEEHWIGVIGYGISESAGIRYPVPSAFALPSLYMARYHSILLFDHDSRTLTCHGKEISLPPAALPIRAAPPPVMSLASNFSRETYLEIIRETVEKIREGAFYQANITRKFHGLFAGDPDPFGLFASLMQKNPAPYGAFLKCGGTFLLSSSPERFLAFDGTGRVETRPIKGSAARSPQADGSSERTALGASVKDRAENLMIVDLMRNDLARACVPGSVKVDALYDVDSFATLHHLSSEVSGLLSPGTTPTQAIAHCFPPGSMTGAPKIAAMRWCAEKEREARGAYSGALGWLGGDGAGEFSVVIRTLILEGRWFEMQAGGGIVADSLPENEWRESLQKLQALAETCGIRRDSLEKI